MKPTGLTLRKFLAPLLVAGAVLGIGRFWYGSMANFSARLAGHELAVEPMSVVIGKTESSEAEFCIRNLQATPIMLVGASMPCNCMDISPIPTKVQGFSLARIKVVLRKNAANGVYKIAILADSHADKRVSLSVTVNR